MKYGLSASIICANFKNLEHDIREVVESGFETIHFDVMDGNYVPRLGLFPEIIEIIRSITNIPIDAHLMVNNPEDYIENFAKLGVNYYTVHYETCGHLYRVISKIKKSGMKVGLALNPATPINTLEEVLDDLDLMLIMGINPGIIGQKLAPNTFSKIKKALDIRKNRKYLISVDGGVSFETAGPLVRAGSDLLVCGTATVFQPPKSILNQYSSLNNAITASS